MRVSMCVCAFFPFYYVSDFFTGARTAVCLNSGFQLWIFACFSVGRDNIQAVFEGCSHQCQLSEEFVPSFCKNSSVTSSEKSNSF